MLTKKQIMKKDKSLRYKPANYLTHHHWSQPPCEYLVHF